jgi:hypothetical protein
MNSTHQQLWEKGWDAHERAQLLRLASLSLSEKLRWLEDAHTLVRHLRRRDHDDHRADDRRHAPGTGT